MPHCRRQSSREARDPPVLPQSHRLSIDLDQPKAGVMCHAGPGQQLALSVPMNDADLGIVIGLTESPQQTQCGTADARKMRPDRTGINRDLHVTTTSRGLPPER